MYTRWTLDCIVSFSWRNVHLWWDVIYPMLMHVIWLHVSMIEVDIFWKSLFTLQIFTFLNERAIIFNFLSYIRFSGFKKP